MKTIVLRQKMLSHNGNEAYSKDKFIYNKEDNTYICTQGFILTCVSKEETINNVYKNFVACKSCPVKGDCTKSERGRKITRGEYEKVKAESHMHFFT